MQFKRSFINLSYYAETFLVGAVPTDVGFHFQNCKQKSDTKNFCLFVYLQGYNNKSKFLFLETVHSSRNSSYLEMSHVWAKCQYRFLALIFLYTLKRIRWKWNWNLKLGPPVGLKFVFEKIKFKVLHYIQNDFIRQRTGFQ